MAGKRTDSGKNLNVKWAVRARHPLYHKDGNWYQLLKRFPGALFDPHGYILFETKEDYLNCRYLDIGERVHVQGKISEAPGYVKVC